MDKEINQIIEQYIYNQSIKKYSNKYYFHDNRYFREIQDKSDVDRALEGIKNTINYYKTIYPLVNDDIEELEKSLGKYEIAVHKVLQCYDILNFGYTANELLDLIKNIKDFENQIQDIHLRKMCQD